jgi:hypothetical protein
VCIDADKVVFNEDIVIEGFVMHFSWCQLTSSRSQRESSQNLDI